MSFRNLLRSLIPLQTPRRRKSGLRPPSIEALEIRLVPAVLSVSDAVVLEGNAGVLYAEVRVNLDAATTKAVTVNYSTANGTANATGDYVAAAGTLTFARGETSKTIRIAVKGDRLGEVDETFFVKLQSPKGAKIADGTGIVTIIDNEPRLSVGDAVVTEGNAETTTASLEVRLSAAYDEIVTVRYATADGTATIAANDYLAASGTLTFLPGETSRTIVIPIRGDRLHEDHETFTVTLSSVSANAGIADGTGVVSIVDDEPRLSVRGGFAWHFDNFMNFTVSLAGPYDEPVTVSFATRDGTAVAGEDYQATSGTLTFAPGETTKTITVFVRVAIYSDPLTQPAEENFYLTLTGASPNARILQSEASGTIFGPPEPIWGDLFGP